MAQGNGGIGVNVLARNSDNVGLQGVVVRYEVELIIDGTPIIDIGAPTRMGDVTPIQQSQWVHNRLVKAE